MKLHRVHVVKDAWATQACNIGEMPGKPYITVQQAKVGVKLITSK